MAAYPMLHKLAEEIEKKPKKENPFAKKDGEEKSKGDEQPPKEGDEQPPAKDGAQPQQPAASINPTAIMDFLASAGTVDDGAFHAFAEKSGFDVPKAEAAAYGIAQRFVTFLRGGKSKSFDPNSVDPKQLEMGMKIEAEHSDDPVVQKKIALDHLAERPDYYSDPMFQKEMNAEQGGGQQKQEGQKPDNQNSGATPPGGQDGQPSDASGKRGDAGSSNKTASFMRKKAVITKTAARSRFLTNLAKALRAKR